MAAISFLPHVFLHLIPHLPMAGDELDEATRELMVWRARYLEKKLAQLYEEMEEKSLMLKPQEQCDLVWPYLVWPYLVWPYLVIAGGLLLLFGLCWCFRKRRREADSSSSEESSGCNMLKEKKEESEREGPDDERDQVLNLEPVEEEEEEEKEESEREGPDDERDQVLNLEPVEEEEEEEKKEESEGEVSDEDLVCILELGEEEEEERDVVGSFERHSRRPVRCVMYRLYRCLVVEELVVELLWVIKEQLAESFSLVLQQAISVGSSFEGWSPCDDDAVYQVLLPLKAPHGHTFNLELDTTREMPAGAPRIRVDLECTCTGQQMQENMPCVFHPPLDITKNQDPSFLQTFCISFYLDVRKTARWFQTLIMTAWRDGPRLRCYNMKMLPSSRSCRLELTGASGKTFFIEFIFGVQHGDSDIFLGSQAPEDTSTLSTTWPVTYAVAEVKFFKYMARQVPPGRVHLWCLHYCAHVLKDTSLSPYIFKTALMHLLTTILPSDWHSKYLPLRLRDLMQYVHRCLKEKRLNHFFLGNEKVPEEISLPPSFREAEPLNLFQRFTEDPVAYAEALSDFKQLRPLLLRLLDKGR